MGRPPVSPDAASDGLVGGRSAADVDFADVQGLVRFAHRKLVLAAFVLVKIRDAAAARAWCAQAPVTNSL